jgi:hypothetical protein
MDATERDALLAAPDEALLAACRVDTYRASGPGGQHRNVTDSAVRLVHEATGVSVTATERRSQHENRPRAVRRLRKALAVEVRCPAVPDAPPAGDLAAVVSDPAWPRVSRKSAAYHVAAARVLDRLEAAGGSVGDVSRGLGVSTASLVRFLGLDADLWGAANRIRARHGRKPLRK